MAINWTIPATWELDDVFNAATLNQQIRDNMEYLASRPLSYKKHVYSSNEDVYPANVGWTHIPDLDLEITTETGRLMYQVALPLVDHNRATYWDVYVPELNIWLSSDTSTPATYGLLALQTSNVAYDVPAFVQGIMDNVAGTYTFELHMYANAIGVNLQADVAITPIVREV